MKSNYIGIASVLVVIVLGLFFINKTRVTAPTTETQKTVGTTEVKTETKGEPVTTTTTNSNTKTTMTQTTTGGLIIVDEVIGTGATATAGDSVTVQYVGSLTNGTVFDASKSHGDQGFTFKLGAGQVIKGWDVGVAGMKVGGKRKLTIPSDMAYGNQAVGGVIPANSTLIFEVELLKTSR